MKSELRTLLEQNYVTVTFKKSDGTVREMLCTLKPEYLGDKIVPESGTIPVWSVNDKGWRSFKEDSVISFTI